MKHTKILFFLAFILSFITGILFLSNRTKIENFLNKLNSPKIDYSFNGTFPGSGFALRNENKVAGFKVFLAQNGKTTIPSGRFEANNGWIDFNLLPQAVNLKKTQYKKISDKGKDVIVWENAMPWTDISFRMKDDGLKEEIVIKDKALALSAFQNHEPLNISYRLIPRGVKPRVDLSGKLSSFRTTKTGVYSFHIEKPFLIDAKGVKYDLLDYEFTSSDAEKSSSYDLSLILPREWLTEPTRVYPVKLDTSIVRNEQAGNLNGL